MFYPKKEPEDLTTNDIKMINAVFPRPIQHIEMTYHNLIFFWMTKAHWAEVEAIMRSPSMDLLLYWPIMIEFDTPAGLPPVAGQVPKRLAVRAERIGNSGADLTRKLIKRQEPLRVVGPPALQMMSQEPRFGMKSFDYLPEEGPYNYHPVAGEGMFVYILDSGSETTSDDYTKMHVTPEWLFPSLPGVTPFVQDRIRGIIPNDDHGTCVRAYVAGYKYGVAKKATVVIVKEVYELAPSNDPLSPDPVRITTLHNEPFELNAILTDIHAKGRGGRSIVQMAFSFPLPESSAAVDRDYKELNMKVYKRLTKWFEDIDVLLVVAAGNKGLGAVCDLPVASCPETTFFLTIHQCMHMGLSSARNRCLCAKGVCIKSI